MKLNIVARLFTSSNVTQMMKKGGGQQVYLSW